MGGSIYTVLAVAGVAVVVTAAPSYINNVALKDGISIRKCDFPFPRPTSIGGPSGELCNGRVFCVDDAEGPNNPWYILQSRSSRSRAFNKNYSAYEQGFGESLVDDYWLGLMCLQMMTAAGNNELLVRMVDREGDVGTAVYSSFSVGLPSAKYQLRVEEFDEKRSDAGDSMSQSNGMRFTALDQDNDEEEDKNCANKLKGGWWYQDCNFHSVNNFLNSYFSRGGYGHRDRGVQWETWETQSTVVSTFILFRPGVKRATCEDSTSKAPIYTCPNGTAKFENSSCFLVADSSFAGTSERAAFFCNSVGMRVASIRSPEEQAFVARQLIGSVWIDLKDEVNEGVFVWGDGTPIKYTNFGAGEPNDTRHKENCIAMNSGLGYKWVDQPCFDRNQYLCKTATVVS